MRVAQQPHFGFFASNSGELEPVTSDPGVAWIGSHFDPWLRGARNVPPFAASGRPVARAIADQCQTWARHKGGGRRLDSRIPPGRRRPRANGQMARTGSAPEPARRIMETKPPVPRAILVGVQLPGVDDVMHAASLGELGRLVKTLGYEVVGTVSQKRDEIGGGTVLGKGRLEELAAMTGGTGVVESMAPARKSKARERFDDAGGKKPRCRRPSLIRRRAAAGVRDRRSRDIAEPGPQPRARHRRAGARPHRRDRRDLPSPCA